MIALILMYNFAILSPFPIFTPLLLLFLPRYNANPLCSPVSEKLTLYQGENAVTMATTLSMSVCVCGRVCLCDISYSFSPKAFKFADMVTMDKARHWIDSLLVTMAQFSMSRGHYIVCFKINFVYSIFPSFFANGF